MIRQCLSYPIYVGQLVEKSTLLKKDLRNRCNVCAAVVFLSSLLWGYMTVTRSLLDLEYQFATNLLPIYQTRTLRFQIDSYVTTLAGLFIRTLELWLVGFVCWTNLRWLATSLANSTHTATTAPFLRKQTSYD